MNRVNEDLRVGYESLREALFEVRVMWGEEERELLLASRRLYKVVEGTRNTLAMGIMPLVGTPVARPLPREDYGWDWDAAFGDDDEEWKKVADDVNATVRTIEAAVEPRIATRARRNALTKRSKEP
jgi:hypothetical protein